MALTLEEVEHIARLARLDLSPEQKALYREQLSHILDHIAQLKELDTSAVAPTAGGGLARMDLRQDQAKPSLTAAALLKNAPQTEDDQFKIPPVFE
jgi:aspartyl-tRNA(Asn)/glutamyl-tRNA(Gln) amidotransferase subunit C